MATQETFGFSRRGGARPGAGRKRVAGRRRVAHRRRPALAARFPVHVTLRVRGGLPTLRSARVYAALRGAMEAGRERFGFRLVHHSVQTNHLHLVVEANDRRALSRGMAGLSIRIARALNRHWRRRSKLFADRYHARILRTPREVRNALGYVPCNARHHGAHYGAVDPYSSGACFDGWSPGGAAHTAHPSVRERARTWLLRIGWRRHGPIPLAQLPGRARSAGRSKDPPAALRSAPPRAARPS